jgi:phosphoribosyl 1,2-cyclic phosphodiesterase
MRLAEIGVSLSDIDGIIITHEHHDHISGLKAILKDREIPIFANRMTAKEIVKSLPFLPRMKIFTTLEPFSFHGVTVQSFPVQHDTVEPVGLTLKVGQMKIGICTDLGYTTPLVEKHLKECDYLYIEANHDPSMVHACARPQVYKKRVLGRLGHLSNDECGKLICSVFHTNLKKIYLAHLSSECNSPEKALHTVQAHLTKEKKPEVKIVIAYQDKISERVSFDSFFSQV